MENNNVQESQDEDRPPIKVVNGEARPSSGRKRKILFSLLTLALVAGLGASLFLLKEEKQRANEFSDQAYSLLIENTKLEADTKESAQTALSDGESAGDGKEEPMVVYEPAGVFSAADKAKLEKMLINPYVDYNESKGVVLILIEDNNKDLFTNGDSDDKYIVSAYGEEFSEGFLFGSKKNGIDWYVPTCALGDCKLEVDFRDKYPEIAKKFDAANR